MRHTVGVFLCVLDRTMSKKSAAVGTGAIAFIPLVDMVVERDDYMVQRKVIVGCRRGYLRRWRRGRR